ncbi:hypothetical protein jhhlp_006489 [Lomentospora prolificans]|uniref:DUF3824 domain-containing protein n=1 Tax=Lomentospora prolificans TaxID=41688 RepID=A0A2N3N621_9PEZI|nr:hypothetical protein jhhlp_006489 [Lomentospora prolificans]
MSAYDPYDSPRPRYDDRERRHRHGDTREVRETYTTKVYPTSRELVPHHREDVDSFAIERAYPEDYSSRDVRRARSAEPGYYDDDYYDRDAYRSRGGRKGGYADSYYEAEEKRRRRVLSRQQKIIAAVAGAALAVGGKEIYDRRSAVTKEEDEIHRNYLHSVALGAAGAVAGYQGAELYNKHASKPDHKSTHVVHRGRDGRVQEYYYSDSDDDPPAKKGHNKFLESALGVTSLGAAMKALTGGGSDKHSDDRSRRGRSNSRDSARSTRSRGHSMSKIQKAAMASLLAGATEAFRIAKEPGGWKGEKAKRIVTAAIGAGAIGGAQDDDKHNKRDIAESVIGGLLGNRVLHGSKKNIEEDEVTGRSRSRSRVRSRSENRGGSGSGATGLAALASAGLAAFSAKKAIDSRDDSRGRSHSAGDRHRSRSRSVVDSARRSLAKFGIGSDPDADRRDNGSDHDGSRSSRRHRRYDDDEDDDYDDDYRRSSRKGRDDRYSSRRYDGDEADDRYRSRRSARSDAGSSTDLGDSSDDERRAKKLRGKQIITSGLAAVAAIHAAHGVYENMGKRVRQNIAVKEGRITAKRAQELQAKAVLKDTAKIGLAALGVKGALAEFKAAKNTSQECRAFREEKQRRHERRLERRRRLSSAGPPSQRRVEDWLSSPDSGSYRSEPGGPRYEERRYPSSSSAHRTASAPGYRPEGMRPGRR